jgi:Fur family ferric uptake transcriptional regulator
MNTWEQRLVNAGYRITQPRRSVIAALQRAETPLSPQEILAQARSICRKLGLVTVYRTLNLLTEMNLVRRIHREDGCHGYLPASLGHHHALICQSCGRAAEFPGEDDISTLIERVEATTGYRVDEHLLQLFGHCPDCQVEEN